MTTHHPDHPQPLNEEELRKVEQLVAEGGIPRGHLLERILFTIRDREADLREALELLDNIPTSEYLPISVQNRWLKRRSDFLSRTAPGHPSEERK